MSNVRASKRSAESFESRVDIAVVGAGAAGLITALAASESGASAIVLERDATPSGSTALSAGLIPAPATRWQQRDGVEDSAAQFADDIINKSDCSEDRPLATLLASQVGTTLHWLADRWQVPLSLVDGFTYPGHSVRRMHGTPTRTGRELIGCLIAAIEQTSVDVVTSARVVELFHDDDQVTGLSLERPGGAVETLGASVVVLACNGYGGNPSLIAKHIPSMRDGLYFGHPGNTGDAVLWGEQLGLATRHLGAWQGHGSVAKPHAILISWAVMMEGGIQVNAKGERFSNEHDGYSEQAERVIAQPGAFAWNIFDQRIHDIAMQFEDFRDADTAGALLRANDAEELAEWTGLSLLSLKETLSNVAALASDGSSDATGRSFTLATALSPPYYAVRVEGALFHTQGGLDIDSSARVLRLNGQPVPNLFATGGAARGVSGPGVSGYLSGNGLLTATALSHIAGAEAARSM